MGRRVDLEGLVPEARALLDRPGRQIMAIAGAPGSGKSTLVENLAHRLQATHAGAVAILPMDGFHYDDAVLRQRGRLAHKGAPDTFDTGGLASALDRLGRGDTAVAVPVFDRALEVSRGSARIIEPQVRLILCEGNYLLLDQPPWRALARHFDCSVMIEVPEPVLAERLRARWQGYGLSRAEIDAKLEANDLPNGRTVRRDSREADLILVQ